MDGQSVHAEDVRFINDVMNSWVVQGVLVVLFLCLLVVALRRASTIFDDEHTRRMFRIAGALLGVLIVVQAAATVALGRIPYPPLLWLEFLWLFALWLYYFVRAVTRQRSGRGDAESIRRGAALDDVIARAEEERQESSGSSGHLGDGGAALR